MTNLKLDNIISEIDISLKRIKSHPEYSKFIYRDTTIFLLEEASRHSSQIEIIGEGSDIKNIGKRKKRDKVSLANAWNYILKHGLNLGTLAVLGHQLDGSKNLHRNFRSVDDGVNFGPNTAPDYSVIPTEINSLLTFVYEGFYHPAIISAELHLGIIQIHPWRDGNGRLARLLQNYTLFKNGFPPVIIPASSRKEYISNLNLVIPDRYSRKESRLVIGENGRKFHEFMASKLLDSISDLEAELSENRFYEVSISSSDPSVFFKVSKSIRYLSRDGLGHAVKVTKNFSTAKNESSFYVSGNVSKEEINRVMVRNFDGKYKISPVDGFK